MERVLHALDAESRILGLLALVLLLGTPAVAAAELAVPGDPGQQGHRKLNSLPDDRLSAGWAAGPVAAGSGYSQPTGSERVREVQQRLTRLGYAPGRVDGLFGPATQRAARHFQRDSRLQMDGIVGPRTLRALRSRGQSLPGPVDRPGRRLRPEREGSPRPGAIAVTGSLSKPSPQNDGRFPAGFPAGILGLLVAGLALSALTGVLLGLRLRTEAGAGRASTVERARAYVRRRWARLGGLPLRVWRFGLVGASGLVVNSAILFVLAELAGLNYLVAIAIATQGSTAWNFAGTEGWVFREREAKSGLGRRLLLFFAINNAALVARVPLILALTAGLGVHYLASNLISLVVLGIARYALADLWIWRGATKRSFSYDIHGILSVHSEVALPELERFRVGELPCEPTINVSIGALGERSGDEGGRAPLASQYTNANGAHANGAGDNGAHQNGANGAHPTGDAANANANANGKAPHGAPERLHYSEAGPLGFGVEIAAHGERFEVRAKPLLRYSPHVLYTNIVEPILRWAFCERGYALVHAACFAAGERAFMVTARTDTGKTTTTLKTLDRHPYSFVSDDLTLVRPDGRVLTYPKPLTISRHTVAAVKTPLLSRRERIALIFQSRLHSRSGRRLAFVIAKLRLPAATINALVQLICPPPKYQVERLIPSAKIAPEANLRGLVVIERGGVGEAALSGPQTLEILLRNCEDAYGFPPYAEIEGFLHSRSGADLKSIERGIIASALSGVPASVLRSETMDWWQRMPGMVERATAAHTNGAANGAHPNGAAHPNGHQHTNGDGDGAAIDGASRSSWEEGAEAGALWAEELQGRTRSRIHGPNGRPGSSTDESSAPGTGGTAPSRKRGTRNSRMSVRRRSGRAAPDGPKTDERHAGLKDERASRPQGRAHRDQGGTAGWGHGRTADREHG